MTVVKPRRRRVWENPPESRRSWKRHKRADLVALSRSGPDGTATSNAHKQVHSTRHAAKRELERKRK